MVWRCVYRLSFRLLIHADAYNVQVLVPIPFSGWLPATQVGKDGVETLDTGFFPLFCGNPVCRGMALDLVGMFSDCSNAATGNMGLLTRKMRALKNSVKTCGNVPGMVMNRQQMAIKGVVDPLSRMELLETERFATGRSVASRLGFFEVGSSPVLGPHTHQCQSTESTYPQS